MMPSLDGQEVDAPACRGQGPSVLSSRDDRARHESLLPAAAPAPDVEFFPNYF